MRINILRILVIGLICSGLGLSIAQPAEANKSSRDFANWLQSVAKKAQAPEVGHKLASLKDSNANLYQLIEQASQIVSKNNEDFNLPLNRDSDSKNIHQILLVGWDQFQTGNAMAAVPPAPGLKSLISFQAPKAFTADAEAMYRAENLNLFFTPGSTAYENVDTQPFSIAPMSGGVAIGAP